MEPSVWLQAAGTLGVPSVIALFLVWNLVDRFTKSVDANTKAIGDLQKANSEALGKLGEKIDAGNAERRLDAGNVQQELRAQTAVIQTVKQWEVASRKDTGI